MTASTRLALAGVPNRAQLFAVLLVAAAINGLSYRMAESVARLGPVDAALGLFGISGILWFAFYGMLRLATENPAAAARADRRDWLVAGALLLACLMPSHVASSLAMLATALYLLAVSSASTPERRVAVVALACTAPLVMGPMVLNLAGPELLSLDAQLAALLTGYPRTGNTLLLSEGRMMLVYPGCSALQNISLVFVLLAALTQMLRVRLSRPVVAGSALAIVAVIAVNTVRLGSLAWFPAHFDYLHHGPGSTLFGWATLVLIVLFVGAGILRTGRAAD